MQQKRQKKRDKEQGLVAPGESLGRVGSSRPARYGPQLPCPLVITRCVKYDLHVLVYHAPLGTALSYHSP